MPNETSDGRVILGEILKETVGLRGDIRDHLIAYGKHETEDNATHAMVTRHDAMLNGDGTESNPGMRSELTTLKVSAITTGRLWAGVGGISVAVASAVELLHRCLDWLTSIRPH